MKTVSRVTFLLLLNFSCFSQNTGTENLDLVFYDNCINKMIEPEFEIFSTPKLNSDYITIYKEFGDWILQYTTSRKTKNDTIQIPRILFAIGSELHSRSWTYLNCDKICDGKETDFYANGNKRTDGIYESGKPIEIKEYWKNGQLRARYFFENLTLNYKRIDYFDETGELDHYEVFRNKKKKL